MSEAPCQCASSQISDSRLSVPARSVQPTAYYNQHTRHSLRTTYYIPPCSVLQPPLTLTHSNPIVSPLLLVCRAGRGLHSRTRDTTTLTSAVLVLSVPHWSALPFRRRGTNNTTQQRPDRRPPCPGRSNPRDGSSACPAWRTVLRTTSLLIFKTRNSNLGGPCCVYVHRPPRAPTHGDDRIGIAAVRLCHVCT